MSKYIETLRLKELAEEAIYFAKRDQELIRALHSKRLAEALAADSRKDRQLARAFEKQYRKVGRACRKEPLKLILAIRALLDRILAAFHLTDKPSD